MLKYLKKYAVCERGYYALLQIFALFARIAA